LPEPEEEWRAGIGHNSAGADIEPEPDAFATLAARAASIHAEHVARRRKTLSAFTLPGRGAGAGTDRKRGG
jgi:hypothetical protein